MSQEFVIKILKEYYKWEKIKIDYENKTYHEKDKLRLEYDEDAKYYYNELGYSKEKSLHADTMVSFWTIYKRLLKLEANWEVSKTLSSLNGLLSQINARWDNDFTEKIIQVNNYVENFAKYCYTKGNYILLPHRRMNNERYQKLEDRIALTIYECFYGGILSKYFINNESLINWVEEQNLTSLFYKNYVSKDNINWFIKNENNHKLISEMNKEEINNYIENSIHLIINRNRIIEKQITF
ncbi:hypothetical protein ACQRBF_05765 [Peptoniphilaceae bacterium SGI.131]